MADHKKITMLSTTPIDKIAPEAFVKFKEWVHNDKLKPSAALRKFMDVCQCPNPDSAVVIRFIEIAYPEIDISRNNFTFKIHDSGYPCVREELNDDGFDQLVEAMRSLPPEKW